MVKKGSKAAVYFLVLAATILIAACETFRSKEVQDKGAMLLGLKEKFKYRNLTVFETDTLNFDNRPGHYNEPDSNNFKLIFQQENRPFIGQGYDRDYFYSWQERDVNFIEFIILTQEEGSYCEVLRYYIFDRQGKFISSFDVAASCGDAEWSFTGSGRQLNRQTFLYETIESDQKRGPFANSETFEGDSISYLITIDSSGRANKKETAKKHFVTTS